MIILKFGGSSLSGKANLDKALEIIGRAGKKGRVGVVVSAVGGITNKLQKAVDWAAKGESDKSSELLKVVFEEHYKIIKAHVAKKFSSGIKSYFANSEKTLAEFLHGLSITGEASDRARDYVIGFGELLSSTLLSAALSSKGVKATPVDARAYIVTDDHFGSANIEWKTSTKNIKQLFTTLKGKVPIITGFIGATKDNIPTTIGRNGSDYTAAFVAAAIDAKGLEIWTDVDGVMSADPRVVQGVFPVKKLNYQEVMELAYFGAKVIHPKTLGPVIDKKIPIRIKNTLYPEKPGTLISSETDTSKQVVKGIASIENLALITLVGRGMMGVHGVAERFFGALSRSGANVVMISQGSSEQNICSVVEADKAAVAAKAVKEEFELELSRKRIQTVNIMQDIVVVAAVGAGMKGYPGVAGRLFSVLGRNNVNVIAIAQGASETNISFVVSKCDEVRALNLIHGAFHLSTHNVNLFIVGKGTIGGKLLELIGKHKASLLSKSDINMRVVGVADSKKYFFDSAGVLPGSWKKRLTAAKQKTDFKKITETLWNSGLENLIFVDATANQDIAKGYPEILSQGISVVTPNKKANTLATPFYNRLMGIRQKRTAHYLYETSVGAGLPVISTLRDLIDSGDDVVEISGVLSGTLSYLFYQLNNGASFSETVKKAKNLGLTEPDPREDLSGQDVARKVLILAREMGLTKELKDIKVESLVPPKLRKCSIDAFLKGMEKEDNKFAAISNRAQKKRCALQYVGEIKNGRISVGLKEVSFDSPFSGLTAGDNMVVFKTRRYFDNPLVIRGPGAGPEVTAAGVLADIIKVANLLRK